MACLRACYTPVCTCLLQTGARTGRQVSPDAADSAASGELRFFWQSLSDYIFFPLPACATADRQHFTVALGNGTHDQMADEILNAVQSFSGGYFVDDATLVIIKRI